MFKTCQLRRQLLMPALAVAATAVCFVPSASLAQAPAPQGQPVDLPLAITPPEGMRVTLEVDARNDDVLGLVKDLLNGFTPEAAANPKPAAKPAPAKTTTGAKKGGKVAAVPPTKSSAGKKGSGNEFVDMLQETGLTDILRPISHLHVLVATLEPAPVPAPVAGKLGNDNNVEIRTIKISDYEKTFTTEGGRRLVWSDDKKSRLLIMGFDSPRKQFALVSESGRQITIVRADGYPDVKKLAKLITMFTE